MLPSFIVIYDIKDNATMMAGNMTGGNTTGGNRTK